MHLIPNPRAYQALDGAFTLQDGEKVKSELRIPLVRTTTREARIIVTRNPALQKEAYTLNVTPEKVHITAATPIGAYYALQSLRILADYDIGGRTVPCCSIHDAPRWGWRGMSLDESRHFFGKEEVKRLLDMLFMMKLNVFHWHLTDDQGWRIEIKKYPRLTEIGSKRTCTQVDGWHTSHMVNEPHEGFIPRRIFGRSWPMPTPGALWLCRRLTCLPILRRRRQLIPGWLVGNWNARCPATLAVVCLHCTA